MVGFGFGGPCTAQPLPLGCGRHALIHGSQGEQLLLPAHQTRVGVLVFPSMPARSTQHVFFLITQTQASPGITPPRLSSCVIVND